MTSKELYENKASPKTVLRQAAKEKVAGILSDDEYEAVKAEVLSSDYSEWLDERLVE